MEENTLKDSDYKQLEELLNKYLYTKEELNLQKKEEQELNLSILEEQELLKQKELELLENTEDIYLSQISAINENIQYQNGLIYISIVTVSVVLILVLLYKTLMKFF